MLLSIIIINYKTWEVTSECINALYESLGEAIGESVEILLIDNASGKGDVSSLQKLRDKLDFKFLISDTNLGFAAGCNFGSSMAKGEFLLFLNSDTKIKDRTLLEMTNILKKDEKIAVVGGKLRDEEGKVENSAGNFYNLWTLCKMLVGGERIGIDRFAPTKARVVNWVSGGFMMVRKQAFDKVSGFDEDYFMYLEDMDLCLRLGREGLNTLYSPDSRVTHSKHGSGSRSFAILNIYKSLMVFYKKNRSNLEYTIARGMLYAKAFLVFFIGKITGKKELVHRYSEVLKLF